MSNVFDVEEEKSESNIADVWRWRQSGIVDGEPEVVLGWGRTLGQGGMMLVL